METTIIGFIGIIGDILGLYIRVDPVLLCIPIYTLI